MRRLAYSRFRAFTDLFLAYTEDFDRVARFYNGDPRRAADRLAMARARKRWRFASG